MSALRFCFSTTFYPPHSFGGDGIAIQRLARALVRYGHHVTVVHDVDAFLALHRGPEPSPAAEDDGVEVVSLRSKAGIVSPLLTQQLGRPTIHRRRLKEILDGGKFDVINFHNASLAGAPGIFAYGGDALKIYTAHDHWLVCPSHDLWRHNRELCTGRECFRCQLHHHRPPQLWRYTGLLERELPLIDVFIAMSDFSRNKHYEFGFPRRMEVLPQFLPDVNPAELESPGDRLHDRPYFFFAGRLEKIKGVDNVIRLFKTYPHADLLIAGDGSYHAELADIAAGSDRIEFTGRISAEKLRQYYSHAIATIVPSVCFETFGLVVIESFQRRTPVIARNIGPFPEIIASCGGGELFSTDADLRSSVERLQNDVEYRNTLAENAFNGFTRNWSESAVVPQYLDIVERGRHNIDIRERADRVPNLGADEAQG